MAFYWKDNTSSKKKIIEDKPIIPVCFFELFPGFKDPVSLKRGFLELNLWKRKTVRYFSPR